MSKKLVGIWVNYGVQQMYRDLGIEPRCGICEHFDGDPINVDQNTRFCKKRGLVVAPGNVCFTPERAPGADDE